MAEQKKNGDMSEDELDQIIAEMSKEEEAEEAPAAAPKVALVKSPREKEAGATEKSGQSLTLELNGVVNLKLNFQSGERSIEVVCGEEYLLCRMADGTEFRIPTGMTKKRNAA
jgi:hypothetical protein